MRLLVLGCDQLHQREPLPCRSGASSRGDRASAILLKEGVPWGRPPGPPTHVDVLHEAAKLDLVG